MKLVARALKSPEPQPLEAVVCLQMCEAHLNTLSVVSRFGKRLCLHLPPRDIAGVLVDIARDLACIGPWCSTLLVSGIHRSPASRRDIAAYVRHSRCRLSAAVFRWGRCRLRASCPSGNPSARRCHPADRSFPIPVFATKKMSAISGIDRENLLRRAPGRGRYM
jgi:hypothetical protein